MDVAWIRRPGVRGVQPASLTPFVRRAARLAGCSGRALTIVLCDDAEARALNRTWRGRDRPTDVLSFAGGMEPDGSRDAGDLVISVDTARRQAAARHHPLATEVRYLLLHGLLHLMGFDHETDGGEMEAEERRLRAALFRPRRRRS